MSYQELISKMEELSEDSFQDFSSKIQDWALLHGIGMHPKKQFDKTCLVFAPFLALPSPIGRENFKKALRMQTIFNSLLHKLAYQPDFLANALAITIQQDDFTRRLYEIYKTVKEEDEGYLQKFSLGLLRTDYLPDTDGKLKLVEVNTVASSMSGLITQVEQCHRFVLRELGLEDHIKNLPENSALTNLCSGLIDAWRLYGNERAVVLFLVEETTYNIADQRFMEFEISRQNAHVRTIRRSLLTLINQAKLGPNKELLLGDLEVAVVYFRSGYDPNQFVNEDCWTLRLNIERSRAIKCPSIQYHLVGTKKVQQVLSEPGVLDQYLPDRESAALVKEMLVDTYPLDESTEGELGYRLALTEPEGFVLKPQREGGGHNIYGSDIPPYLKGLSREEAAGYILMRLICPKPIKNFVLRPDRCSFVETVPELGIYGIILGNDKEVITNVMGGHMIRSKEATAKETGIMAGFGALDYPYLV